MSLYGVPSSGRLYGRKTPYHTFMLPSSSPNGQLPHRAKSIRSPSLPQPHRPCRCKRVWQHTCEETSASKLCSEKKWPRMLSHQPSASAPLTDARLHPPRCTARDSVSLPRKRQKLSHESEDRSSVSCKTSAPQPSPPCSLQKKSSQESDGNLSASQWFDHANSNIDGRLQNQSGYDSRSKHSQIQ